MSDKKQEQEEKRRNALIAWIFIAILLLIPIIPSFLIFKIFEWLIPEVTWSATHLIGLYACSSTIMIAGSMLSYTSKK
jgi:hypothetical protein